MKNQEQEKRFEVVIPPTDVLEKELQDVLGGMGCSTFDCNGFSCNDFSCNAFDSDSKCTGFGRGQSNEDCPPDHMLKDGWCLPKKWLLA